MNNSENVIEIEEPTHSELVQTKRPIILTIICIAIAVYTLVLSMAFLAALIFNNWISITLNDYFEGNHIAPGSFFWLALSGLILNLLSFFAAIRLWQLKKMAYYLYVGCSLFFVLFPFVLGFGNYYSLIIIGLFIGLLSLFLKKLAY